MQITFNSADIFDLVIDEVLGPDQIKEIANQLYADKRGGELVDLWNSEEFLESLSNQLNK